MKYFRGFILALQFLTRIPIPVNCPWENKTIRGALASFSIVGFIIGGVPALLVYLLNPIYPDWILALLVVTVWVYLTGGLHIDGLMDVADAVGSNRTTEKKIQIMKDPHVGSFAVLIVIFHILWKLALVYGLLNQTVLGEKEVLYCLLFIPACSRLLTLFLLYKLPVIKQEGLAFEWKRHLTFLDVFIAFVIVLLISFIVPTLLLLLLSYFLLFFILRLWILHQFKGINGDILGASIEGGELWGLLIISTYIWFVMG